MSRRFIFLVIGVCFVAALTFAQADTPPPDTKPLSLPDNLLPAANSGDVNAQLALGSFYARGPVQTRDMAKAVVWYRLAAEQGNASAETALGYLLSNGLGVPKDSTEAASWYLKAAKQDHASAESNLAILYYRGVGVPQSDRDAFAWFYRAAQQDDPTAEHYLGLFYRDGLGVTRDSREAFNWYYRSAEQGNHYGEWGLGYMYEKGLGVKPDSQVALDWYRKALTGLPQDKQLQQSLALASLKAFFENPDAAPLDLSLLLSIFRLQLTALFVFLAVIYFGSGFVLFSYSFLSPEAPPKLSVALGWLFFYLESQMASLVAIFIFGKFLTAESLILSILLCSALPVVASTFGPHRSRFWNPPIGSWKTLLLYVAGSCLVFVAVGGANSLLYYCVMHESMPLQSTQLLVGKTKHDSIWLAYLTVALIFPAAEEVMFRGYLFDALRKRYSGKVTVVVTAFAFSLMHFQVLYALPLFGGGLILGWVKLKTGSLRLPLLLHGMNNALAVVFAG